AVADGGGWPFFSPSPGFAGEGRGWGRFRFRCGAFAGGGPGRSRPRKQTWKRNAKKAPTPASAERGEQTPQPITATRARGPFSGAQTRSLGVPPGSREKPQKGHSLPGAHSIVQSVTESWSSMYSRLPATTG